MAASPGIHCLAWVFGKKGPGGSSFPPESADWGEGPRWHTFELTSIDLNCSKLAFYTDFRCTEKGVQAKPH